MTTGSMLLDAKRAEIPMVAEATDVVEADAVRLADVRRAGLDAGGAIEPVDILAATTSISFSLLRRRLTDVGVLPTAKRGLVPPADPLANAFGLLARPDPSATDADPEVPSLRAVASADEVRCAAMWRLHEIVLNVDSVTSELRRRISEVPNAASAHLPRRLALYLTPALAGLSLVLWFGIGQLFRGQ